MQALWTALDRRVLALLQKGATLSAAEIGERVGLSQSPVSRRLARLKEGGQVRRAVALLGRDRLGLRAHVFAQLKLTAHGRAHLKEFVSAIRQFPKVLECYVAMGSVDFLLRIVA